MVPDHIYLLFSYILRKTMEGYLNYFDHITFRNIFCKQSKFVSDRTIALQFTKLQNEIHGSLVTIQYHTKLVGEPEIQKLEKSGRKVAEF